jgi:hypothetical protein
MAMGLPPVTPAVFLIAKSFWENVGFSEECETPVCGMYVYVCIDGSNEYYTNPYLIGIGDRAVLIGAIGIISNLHYLTTSFSPVLIAYQSDYDYCRLTD